MPEMRPWPQVVGFGDLKVDLGSGIVTGRGARFRLRHQLLVALTALLERPGETVSRDELKRRLWPGDTVVDFEIDLNTVVARLREALGDSAEHPRYIETLPKRGYRLLVEAAEGPASEPLPGRRVRLIVLPFSNSAGDPAEEYFSDAVTDETITALCQVAPRELAVIARTTAMHYRGGEKDVARIGRELGVDLVVEGAVRRDRDRFALNVQLIQAADQTHIFARRYEGAGNDFVPVIESAARDLARQVGLAAGLEAGPEASGPGAPIRRPPVRDPGVYADYIQARHFMSKGSAEGCGRARQLLERVIEREAEFAPAHDALAEIDWYLGYFGYVPPLRAFADGIVHALRAVEIEGRRAETHALIGEFHKTIDYNWPEVRREMDLALQLDPASPVVRLRYAISGLMPHGRLEEAIAEIEQALEYDPLSMLTQGWLGVMLVLGHHWDRAVEQGLLLLKLFPSDFWGYFILGVAYRALGLFDKAVASLRQAVEVSGGMPGLMGWLGLTLGRSGNMAESSSLLEGLRAKALRGYVPPTSFAWLHLGRGDLDAAFEWLDRAVDERDQFMMPIKSYNFFDPIRADPRFPPLIRKMKLEP